MIGPMVIFHSTFLKTYQIPCAIWSSKVALNIGIENLNCMLSKKTFMEMFIILDQSQPGLQQFIIRFHVYHVILIKLKEKSIHKTNGQCKSYIAIHKNNLKNHATRKVSLSIKHLLSFLKFY